MESFEDALSIEHTYQRKVYPFYKGLETNFGIKLKRCQPHTKSGMADQKRGIDCYLEFGDKIIPIQEKFRTRNYGDVMIELYDQIHKSSTGKLYHVLGNIMKCEAKYIFYFRDNTSTELALDGINHFNFLVLDVKRLQEYITGNGILNIARECLDFTQTALNKFCQDNIPDEYRLWTYKSYSHTTYGFWRNLCLTIPDDILRNSGILVKEINFKCKD